MAKKYDPNKILCIADPHEPFTKPGYIDFCLDVKRKEGCGTVICVGDLVDSYNISLRDMDPNSKSPRDEIKLVRKNLKAWYNLRLYRKARKAGIPDVCMRPFRELWQLPDAWEVSNQFIIDGVLYHHGYSATKNAAITAAIYNRMCVVQGHGHTTATITYSASEIDIIWGMSVGSGIDRQALAFAYSEGFKEKQLISCGTVENGKNPHLHMMDL
jgi:hypothetical protein